MRRQCRCEMSSGREADDADARGVEVPFLRVRTNEAHGLLCVLQRANGFVHHRLVAWNAVLDDECRDAVLHEELRLLLAFEIEGEPRVGAAGKDHDARAVRFESRREIHLDLRSRYVPDESLIGAGLLIRSRFRVRHRSVAVERKGLHLRRKGSRHIERRSGWLARGGRGCGLRRERSRCPASQAKRDQCNRSFQSITCQSMRMNLLDDLRISGARSRRSRAARRKCSRQDRAPCWNCPRPGSVRR